MASRFSQIAKDISVFLDDDGEPRWGRSALREAFFLAASENDPDLAREILERPEAYFDDLCLIPDGGEHPLSLAARMGHWRFLEAAFEGADPEDLQGRSFLSLALLEGCPSYAISEILERFPLMAENSWLRGENLILDAGASRDPDSLRLVAVELSAIADPGVLAESLLQAADSIARWAACAPSFRAKSSAAALIGAIRLCGAEPERFWPAALGPRSSDPGSAACCEALLADGASPVALLSPYLDAGPAPISVRALPGALSAAALTPMLLALASGRSESAALLEAAGAPIESSDPHARSACSELARACGSNPASPLFPLLESWASRRPEPRCGLDGALVPLSEAFRAHVGWAIDALRLQNRRPGDAERLQSELEALSLGSLSWGPPAESRPKPRSI